MIDSHERLFHFLAKHELCEGDFDIRRVEAHTPRSADLTVRCPGCGQSLTVNVTAVDAIEYFERRAREVGFAGSLEELLAQLQGEPEAWTRWLREAVSQFEHARQAERKH